MRNDTLQVMVSNLRAECGHSLSTTQGLNQEATLKYLLARTQEELWTAFLWPDLVSRSRTSLVAGQYLYSYPIQFDCIREMWTNTDDANPNFLPLEYGFPSEDMILPGFQNSDRADPVQYWQHEDNAVGGHFRVWPTPDTSTGSLRVIGQAALKTFTNSNDVSTLDSTVIILFCAADLLARAKAEDAPGKMQKAQRHLVKLLAGKISRKRKVVAMGSGSPDRRFDRTDDFRISNG